MLIFDALNGIDLRKLWIDIGLSNKLSSTSLFAIFPVFEFRAENNPIMHQSFRKHYHVDIIAAF